MEPPRCDELYALARDGLGHLLEQLCVEVRAPRIHESATVAQRTVIAKELYATQETPA